jgi:ABC-type transport system involved in multi-copper enzyme maturation permease subunit
MGYLGEKASSALTPLWVIGVGALAGMAVVGLLWVLLWGITRLLGNRRLQRVPDEMWTAIREGVLFHVLVVACILAAWGLVGTFLLRPPGDSLAILQSLGRLGQVGQLSYTTTLAPAPQATSEDEIVIPPVQALPVSFLGRELRRLTVESTENVSLATDPDMPLDALNTINITAGVPFTWERRKGAESPLGDDKVTGLYFRNRSSVDAQVTVTATTQVVYPEVRAVLWTAAGVIGVFLLYFLQFTLAPRLSAIALATFKSEVAQPLFTLLVVIGACALVIFIFIPYNTFGEDIKMLKDSGLTMIRVLGILLAVWGASTTISEELENYTALTVLSKPIGRRSFVIGKFTGIAWTTALMFIILGSVLVLVTALKVIYDARENSMELPAWQACYLQASSVVPGLALGFMETLILAALSVAISTRLPMFANFVICFTVYVLGHLTPLIVQVTDERFEIVKFVGQLIATVVPNLEAFDLQTAMAGGLAVPNSYLLWALLYCLLFSVIAMLLALVLFEDRDLA